MKYVSPREREQQSHYRFLKRIVELAESKATSEVDINVVRELDGMIETLNKSGTLVAILTPEEEKELVTKIVQLLDIPFIDKCYWEVASHSRLIAVRE